jgi:hypothetical protein
MTEKRQLELRGDRPRSTRRANSLLRGNRIDTAAKRRFAVANEGPP